MQKRKILIMIMVLVFASTCLGEIRISHRTVQPARALARLLNDRIGTLDDQVATLQAMSGGVYDNIGTGDVFYVDSATGSDTDTGLTWALAKATLDAAVGLCANGNNDVIYVASKHVETLAADVTLDIDGITVIGIGTGQQAPTFTYDTTTDEFIIDAIGVTVYNCRFVAGIAEVVACFTLADESDYFSIISCEFPEPGTATFEFDVVFQLVTGADNGTIAYCTVINQGATPGMTSVIDGGAAAIDSLTVIGNYWNVDADVALIFSDQADTNLLIGNNTFIQEDVDKFGIQLTSTATGLIANNKFCNLGGVAYFLDPGSCYLDGNRGASAIDAPSYPIPIEPAEGRYTGTGNVIYVDSGTPGAGDGRSWGTAVATLDAGVNLCTTLTGNTIYVAAGHTETLGSGADGVDIDLDNITVIGKGSGKAIPFFDYDTVTDEFVIAGDNVHIKNLRFHSNITAVVKAIDIEGGAENFTIEDCLFDLESTGTDDFIDAIIVGAACHGGQIINCKWYMGAGSDNDSAIHFVNADYLRITGCEFYGDQVDAAIFNETTKSLHVTIRDNIIFQGTENGITGLNAKPCISLHTDTSGVIVNNMAFCNVASPDLAIVADECFLSGNTYSENASTAGSFPIGTMSGSGVRWVSVDLASIATPTNDLFQVTGGPIHMLDIVTYVTSTLETKASLCEYNVDPIAPATDTEFGTDGGALDWTGAATGSLFWWDGVVATDLAKIANGVGIGCGRDVSVGLYIPIGMIELTTTATMTGTVTVYMSYIPMSSKSMVIPQ